eukprot:6288175-Prymnesium_polylepis.2
MASLQRRPHLRRHPMLSEDQRGPVIFLQKCPRELIDEHCIAGHGEGGSPEWVRGGEGEPTVIGHVLVIDDD